MRQKKIRNHSYDVGKKFLILSLQVYNTTYMILYYSTFYIYIYYIFQFSTIFIKCLIITNLEKKFFFTEEKQLHFLYVGTWKNEKKISKV